MPSIPSDSDETKAVNPLVSKWQGPYGGVPPFDQVQVALFKPALEAAMVAQLAETERIARNIGLWYFDPYARAGKRSGAWMNAYRTQERVNGEITTIVSNNANFVKGKPGEPLLIS